MSLDVYFDFKSPYSYIAVDDIFALERDLNTTFAWKPISLPPDTMDQLYGDLKNRSVYQENKTKYLYTDCRRLRPDLTIRAPKKYYDSTMAAAGFYACQQEGKERDYLSRCFYEVFANRMEPNNQGAIADLVASLGLNRESFNKNIGDFQGQVHWATTEFTTQGGFGIPTFIYNKELFWGGDRLHLLKSRLTTN